MAKYYVNCDTCKNEMDVYLTGKIKDIEWKLSHFTWTCDNCKQKSKEEQNKISALRNKEEGLPILVGSEKQIAWAETIRYSILENLRRQIKKIKEEKKDYYAIMLNEVGQQWEKILELVYENVKNIEKASYWIDNRGGISLIELMKNTELEDEKLQREEMQKKEEKLMLEAKKEATLLPEKSITAIVAELRIVEKMVEVSFVERNEIFRRVIKEKLEYEWNYEKKAWIKEITQYMGTIQDRIVETGCELLSVGIPIIIHDSELREKIINKEYKEEQTRWIAQRSKGNYKGWFCIFWGSKEDFYKKARKLHGSKYDKPYIVVPSENYEEVIDFANEEKFVFSGSAIAVIEKAIALKETALKVNIEIEDKKEEKKNKKEKVLKIEKVEVLDELRDEEYAIKN